MSPRNFSLLIPVLTAATLHTSQLFAVSPLDNYTTTVRSIEEDKDLGHRLAGRVGASQIDGLARDGIISRWVAPKPSEPHNLELYQFRLSSGVHQVLETWLQLGKTFGILSLGRHNAGFHGAPGSKAQPAIQEEVIAALDISSWNGQSIDISNPEGSAQAIADIIRSLPPGKYDFGFPRRPYSKDRPEATTNDYARYGFDNNGHALSRISHLFDRNTKMLAGDPDDFFNFYPTDRNEGIPVDAAGKPITGFDNQLKVIHNPAFRDLITAAVEARKGEIIFNNSYPDALDHFHISVYDARPPQYTPGDFTGDGRPDLVWTNATTGQVSPWILDNRNVRQNFLMTPPNFDLSDRAWKALGSADFNRDNYPDLVWFNTRSNQRAIWTMAGFAVKDVQIIANQSSPADPAWKAIGVGDFNGDRKPEFFWLNTSTLQTGLWDIHGQGTTPTAYTWNYPGNDWKAAAIADFNHDGSDDVLWRNEANGQVSIWTSFLGQFVGTIDILTPAPTGSEWQVQNAYDMDKDGTIDIIWRNQNSGEISIWYLNPDFSMREFQPLFPTVPTSDWRLTGPSYR